MQKFVILIRERERKIRSFPIGRLEKMKQKKKTKSIPKKTLEIKGSPKYINYLSKHLVKEHPSTKKRMTLK